ncbi:MAG: DedA family protein [Gemmatimonadaceae bacterium]
MQSLFDWLGALPPGALFGAMALLAAAENVFPPIPADVLVAFGGFLAARGGGSPWPAFLCVWIGNVIGAIGMYLLGRRFGSEWIARKFRLEKGGDSETRIMAWHKKYGTAALFVSRFVPGVRAVVPPVTGGLRIPLAGVALAIAAASGIWYGLITWLAFNAGANWETLSLTIKRLGFWMALGAGAILVILVVVIWRRRRR